MAEFAIVDLGTPDEKLRAVALVAATELYSGRGATARETLRVAEIFEQYIRTGKYT